MVISLSLYYRIVHAFRPVPPENGGIIGLINGEVCVFCLDKAAAITDRNRYIPNAAFLSDEATKWAENGIRFAGVVHSHPQNQKELSSQDRRYICEIVKALQCDSEPLFFPIVFPGEKMLSYAARYDGNEIIIEPDEITIT